MSDVTLQGEFGQGGAPIVESGSNANGTYIKYADGTMVCVKRESINTEINGTSGALYTSPTEPGRSFPQTFTALLFVNISVDSSANSLTFVASDINDPASLSSWPSYRLADSSSQGSAAYNVNYLAIGRWK